MADFTLPSTISITCPKGIPPYLKKELEQLGFEVLKVRPAGVEIEGTLEDCMMLNLKLRTAHRIHFLIRKMSARTIEELNIEVQKAAWEEYIDHHGYFSVRSSVNNPVIRNDQIANLTVKDAIADRIRSKKGARPDSGSSTNRSVVFLYWNGSQASVYLDTSGESLSRRGYRSKSHTAAMQESLAAAILAESKWNPSQVLVNPMCGSGTIAIEAALMALNRYPTLLRPEFGIKHIIGFDENRWNELRNDLKRKSLSEIPERIIASDSDKKAIQAARSNAKTAGVEHHIEFVHCAFDETNIPDGEGIVLLNPPYGERLGDTRELRDLYKGIGDFFKRSCSGKWGYVFTGNFDLMKSIGLRTNKRTEFYNSTIECRLLEYELY
jgi:putative N6-adenine-specific DNA methylase